MSEPVRPGASSFRGRVSKSRLLRGAPFGLLSFDEERITFGGTTLGVKLKPVSLRRDEVRELQYQRVFPGGLVMWPVRADGAPCRVAFMRPFDQRTVLAELRRRGWPVRRISLVMGRYVDD